MAIPPCGDGTSWEWFMNQSLVASCENNSSRDDRRVRFDPRTGGLTIRSVSMSDAVIYTCFVSDVAGTQHNITELIVQRSEYTNSVFMVEHG